MSDEPNFWMALNGQCSYAHLYCISRALQSQDLRWERSLSQWQVSYASHSRFGRVVKASDSKSDSLRERRFESYNLRVKLACVALSKYTVTWFPLISLWSSIISVIQPFNLTLYIRQSTSSKFKLWWVTVPLRACIAYRQIVSNSVLCYTGRSSEFIKK